MIRTIFPAVTAERLVRIFPVRVYAGHMRKSAVCLCWMAALVAGAQTHPAQTSVAKFPTSEELRLLRTMNAAELSPRGDLALFSVVDSTEDGGRAHVWLTPTDGTAAARQLTFTPGKEKSGESAASWFPNGKAILFLAHRGAQTQLFRLSLSGGEAIPYALTALPLVDDAKLPDAIPAARKAAAAAPKPLPLSLTGYAVSPDGAWLAVWASDPETPGEKAAKDAKADAVRVDHQTHRTRLYLAHLGADGRRTTDAPLAPVNLEGNVSGAWWSPKSDRLVALVEPPNGANDLKPSGEAWLVSTSAASTPVRLVGAPPTLRGPMAWSADSGHLYFAAQTPEDAPPGVEELYALSAAADAQPQRLMPDFDGGLANGRPVALTDGRVVAPVAEGFRLGAVTVAADGAGKPQPVPQTLPILTGLATNFAQTGWLWFAEASDRAPELCFAARLGGDCRLLQTPSLHPVRAMATERVHWQNAGLSIEGLLSVPPEATDRNPVPLIVEVHGGPLGAWEDRYDPWVSFLLGQGWAVLRPNPRGSSGYGWQFAAANKNDLGGEDFADILAGVDAVLKTHPELNGERLALIGYSYGGEMAGFAEGKTNRFRAIVSGAPVIDQFSEYGTERGSWYDRWYYGLPWEHFTDAWRQSPLSRVPAARTPFLLLQGQADVTDPQGQSEEMYRALRQLNVPVEMMLFPREDHGPLARGIFGYPSPEPWHGWEARQRIVAFLQANLAGK